ncbi:MAG: hypothetical protein HYS22_05550 [Deltaproteobacteria bacterium]|nr:hypothetical protein [Deltaproteobacteria bacterium]
MAASLLDLTLLLGNFSKLGNARAHVLKATREILLAVGEVLELAGRTVNQTTIDNKQALGFLIANLQRVLHRVVSQIPHEEEEEFHEIRQKVISSIIGVINGELARTSQESATEKNRFKMDVLLSIKKVLENAGEEGALQSSSLRAEKIAS